MQTKQSPEGKEVNMGRAKAMQQEQQNTEENKVHSYTKPTCDGSGCGVHPDSFCQGAAWMASLHGNFPAGDSAPAPAHCLPEG